MIVAAGAPSATHVSAAVIAAGSEARAVMTTSHVAKTAKRVERGAETETGVGTEIKVLTLKQTEEPSRAQEPCATARRG